jgi:PAS domain S-box-containing protein
MILENDRARTTEGNSRNTAMIPFLRKLTSDKQLLEAYVETIVSNARIAVLDKHRTIIWVNERFCRLTQYTARELIGQSLENLDLMCIDPVSLEQIFETISSDKKWCGEIRSQAKDGSVFWIKTNILPIKNKCQEIESYLVINSNITATKTALEEKNTALENLMISEARYRALVENQSDLVLLCKADGTRIYVNASYCRFADRTVDELIGTLVQDTPLRGIPQEFIRESLMLTPAHPEVSGVFQLENTAGEKLWISMRVKGIFDTGGNLYEVLTIGRDVTDLKNAELRKGDYIEDLERIAFMTSHNVRGPIATMLGLLELLRLNAIHTDQWNEVLDVFKKCIIDLDVYTREMGAFIYQRQSSK